MPVRKIPKNHIFVTGRHASAKSVGHAEFESLLENDYLILLDFDPQVERYEVQPVRVPVPGVPRGYVPDVLVHFAPDNAGKRRRSELTEVKSVADLQKKQAEYAPKFEAARQYADSMGWTFVCKTDQDIRIPRLKNLKFLRAYRRIQPAAGLEQQLLCAVASLGGRTTSNQLLDSCCSSNNQRIELLPVLWHLVVTRRIMADWDHAFEADVPLWLEGAHE